MRHSVRFLQLVIGVACAGLVRAESPHAVQLLPNPARIEMGKGDLRVCSGRVVLDIPAGNRQADAIPVQELMRGLERVCLKRQDPIAASSDKHAPGEQESLPVLRIGESGKFGGLPGVNDSVGQDSRESYRLYIDSHGLNLQALSPAGLDAGIQTILQLLLTSTPQHPTLPALQIVDWPQMAYRGLMIDTAHGPRPTLDSMHWLIDEMEASKLNQLYLYAEANLPLSEPKPVDLGNRWSLEEIHDLIDYAAQRHIDVVPCVELYGHLHDLLSEEQFSPLGALPHGGELNPADARSSALVSSWLQQLVSLFPSPWIHIGFDEPFELGYMDAASRHGIAPDRLWADHLRRTAEAVEALGRRPIFWADINGDTAVFNKYPHLAEELPQNVVAAPWFYAARETYAPLLSMFAQHRVQIMVAPAVSDWNEIFPDYRTSLINMAGMVQAGNAIHALGMINTLWSDSAMATHRTAWPGIAYGAAAAWQQQPPPSEGFFHVYAALHIPLELRTEFVRTYEELSAGETLLKESLGDATLFRLFDAPFDPNYLARARSHRTKLIEARVHIQNALDELDIWKSRSANGIEVKTLLEQAHAMDYSALRALYAVEIEDQFRNLPEKPDAEEVRFWLNRETASWSHSRTLDLIDRAGTIEDEVREACLAESLPFRLNTALARWSREQQNWIGFQEHILRLANAFRSGDPRPTLEQALQIRP